MWLRMPNGCDSVSIEQQEFHVEVRDELEQGYVRIPNHFAPRLLAISGFAVAEPPAGAPADLPLPDPLRDGAIANLTKENEALKRRVMELTADINSAQAGVTALRNERATLQANEANLLRQIETLNEKLEERPVVVKKEK